MAETGRARARAGGGLEEGQGFVTFRGDPFRGAASGAEVFRALLEVVLSR